MLGAHQGSHSCSHLCCFPVGESLHRVKHPQAVPLFVSLALRHSSPPAPTCGPCEVARLRQSADQCCPEYECGTWPALGAAPPPRPQPQPRVNDVGVLTGVAEWKGVGEADWIFQKNGKSNLWKIGFAF